MSATPYMQVLVRSQYGLDGVGNGWFRARSGPYILYRTFTAGQGGAASNPDIDMVRYALQVPIR